MHKDELASQNKEFYEGSIVGCLLNPMFDMMRSMAARRCRFIRTLQAAGQDTMRTATEDVPVTIDCGHGTYLYLHFDHQTALSLDEMNIKWSSFCGGGPLRIEGNVNEVCEVPFPNGAKLRCQIKEYEAYDKSGNCMPDIDPLEFDNKCSLSRTVELKFIPAPAHVLAA